MKKYGFGVDVGGTTCKIGIVDVSGTLLEKWEVKTDTSNGGQTILKDIAKEIKNKIHERHIDQEEIIGVGIGVPGPVLDKRIVNRCVNLGWGVVDVADEMRRLTGLSVKVENDANLAALGEMWKGSAEGTSDVIMVTLGTGVGSGIIIDGNIISGSAGAAGEIGHILVNEKENVSCSCGKKGCLEQYVSATGIVRMAKDQLHNYPTSILNKKKNISAKTVFDAAKKDDVFAKCIVEQFGNILGSALAVVSCVINPESIVIGGGVSNAGTIILDAVDKAFYEKTFHACKNVKISLAELGNDAGIYGGVYLVMTR